jgi:hypothetical protein
VHGKAEVTRTQSHKGDGDIARPRHDWLEGNFKLSSIL